MSSTLKLIVPLSTNTNNTVDTIKKAGVDVDQVPDHVQNALTKDYSKVMKAIDQKKNGGYRP